MLCVLMFLFFDFEPFEWLINEHFIPIDTYHIKEKPTCNDSPMLLFHFGLSYVEHFRNNIIIRVLISLFCHYICDYWVLREFFLALKLSNSDIIHIMASNIHLYIIYNIQYVNNGDVRTLFVHVQTVCSCYFWKRLCCWIRSILI